MLIDSHAHLGEASLRKRIAEVVRHLREMEMTYVVNICTCSETLKTGISLSEIYPEIVCAGATTPHDVAKEGDVAFVSFAEAAHEKKLIAIGETGLDYYYEHSPKKLQQEYLVRYFDLAIRYDLPMIYHCRGRKAFEDLFALADAHYKNRPAVLHCFTGDREQAMQVMDRGWFLSLSGILTFKKSEALREIAKEIPLSRVVLETDAPYLTPQSKRGKINEPAFLVETAECLATIRKLDLEEIIKITSDNSKRLFRLR